MNNNVPKIQLTIILASVVYFSTIDAGISAFYGGIISLINTALINRHMQKCSNSMTMDAQTSVAMMTVSVITRMMMAAGLTLIGFFLLELNSEALIFGLVFGLIGFLIDKVK
ncbi:FIG048548: ATP synthase protein I2 [Bathymodiolus thermophilus thioautotrophic gill symbiont]|uniref:ATP synthase subunit I n=1 Tax=Bathymodiolus thermophilus thioautotrophic gill symbiont TaxID=2360 RepID=UPI0010B12F98|nr:ATP synthase subunit I [Bathymodiolus thermophilus thioautotrophic gill symbiont]SHA14169.1 FIG048548: ATP synthase protein I2 [Bathymodiolus thermophilus thioautotrophic gill symbiont]